jgi:exonuclease III
MLFEGDEISISTINCNSLNMSNSAKWNQTLKICGITKLKSDIIFLSDTRVSNKNLISSGDDLRRNFLNNPYGKYDFFFNSTKNKRGTGILIKKNLTYNILEQRASEDENSLLLRLRLKNSEVVLVSIYGPNSNDELFFNRLHDWVSDFQHLPIILGGDWNATYCNRNINENIDCFNMIRPPNLLHSNKIAEMCENFNLLDPYRTLFPEAKDFTYVPRNVDRTNKSRIDFFLVSDQIFDIVKDCFIAESLQNKLFDHRAVTLKLNRQKVAKTLRPTISKKELDDDIMPFVVHAAVAETYLIHCAEDNFEQNRQLLINTCGIIRALIREAGPPFEIRAEDGFTEEDLESRSRKLVRLQILTNSLNIGMLENLRLTTTPDVFMETLLLNVKNDVISHQTFVRKKKFEKIISLKKTIEMLKTNFDVNSGLIWQKEQELNLLTDIELRKELQKFSSYDILNTEKMTPRFLSLSKATNKTMSLDCVCRDDGSEFSNKAERHQFISDFYARIYTPPQGNRILHNGCIEEFLGPEICANEAVQSSKLSEAESLFF